MTDHPQEPTVGSMPEPLDSRLSRRTFLKAAVGAAGVGMTPLLTGFGGRSSLTRSAAPGTAASGAIRRGGTLRVGLVGGGTAETQAPALAVTPIDSARVQNLFDPLVFTNPDLTTSPALALEWNANKDATVYEVKLRPGVTFHNGKTFGADDVIYSIGLMAKPTSNALPFVSGINLREIKAINQYLLRIPLLHPDADLAANFQYYNCFIVQNGEKDFMHPIGTGPFEFVSFTPGQQSIYKRNPNYWVSGKPYVDHLQLVSISDPTARLNALLSGRIDAMGQLPALDAKAHQNTGGIRVLVVKSPQAFVFYMDTTKPPFTDNRVRLAMKLIANRPALIQGALSGYGSVGNDLVGKGLPFYDDSLPQRVQDIAQAKSLLKSAGQENLNVLLQTSDIVPGFVESATLLAQQAASAGVKVRLQQVPSNAYYNPSLVYLKMRFAQDNWAPLSLKFFYLQALASNAPYPETHWHSPSFQALLLKAIGELNHAKAQAYWNQVQKIQYEQGGYLNWSNADWVDGLSLKVHGLVPSQAGFLGNLAFDNVWLSA